MRQAQKALYTLVERIFQDGVMTADERSELLALYRESALTVSEVREVYRAFMTMTWGEAIADGVLTTEERQKLAAIARELNLPDEVIPEAAKLAMGL